jgi:TIR domain
MAGIFISYRRDDSQGWVGRLARALQESFPRARVFYDIAAIQPGEDFVAAIEDALSCCQAVLAIIGPRWLSAQTAEGQRRIDDPIDFVRLEIETALVRPVRVVPVLLGGAAMPNASELPESLLPLTRRQAHEISDKRWDYDCDLLLKSLGETLGIPTLLDGQREGASPGSGISVGQGLTITNSRIGDIAGVKVSGEGQVVAPGPIDVARNARLKDAEVEDIAGVKTQKKDSE